MSDKETHPRAVRYVQADRITTEHAAGHSVAESVCVVEEAAVTIEVEGVETFTILCTPTERRALAVGFLFSEGVIDSMTDIKLVKHCQDDPNTIRVQLTHPEPRVDVARRNLLIVSSCGSCGSEHLNERIDALPKVGDDFRIEAGRLQSVYGAMSTWQNLFRACGGTHAAAVFNEHGAILACAEDTGRHNALDKAVGRCVMDGIRTADQAVALTSRLSLEMVAKCARAGIELIAAVSAPTSLAIDVAQKCNITLCAFVRERRATVFTHPHRVLGAER